MQFNRFQKGTKTLKESSQDSENYGCWNLAKLAEEFFFQKDLPVY